VWLVLAGLAAALIVLNPVGRRTHTPSPEPGPSGVPADAGVAPVAPGDDAAIAESATADAAAVADAAAPIDAPPAAPLYTVTEALDDIAAGPLEFIGTGPWFGNASIHACAYRNSNVIVVNEYCTAREMPALGLIVLSPTRGRIEIYAEAEHAISTLGRNDYFTFRVAVQPPLEELPTTLEMTYAELDDWEERRYNAHANACFHEVGKSGCLSDTPQLSAWLESATPFVADPPARWYDLAKKLRTLKRRAR
jgi:hypothetical protein